MLSWSAGLPIAAPAIEQSGAGAANAGPELPISDSAISMAKMNLVTLQAYAGGASCQILTD